MVEVSSDKLWMLLRQIAVCTAQQYSLGSTAAHGLIPSTKDPQGTEDDVEGNGKGLKG